LSFTFMKIIIKTTLATKMAAIAMVTLPISLLSVVVVSKLFKSIQLSFVQRSQTSVPDFFVLLKTSNNAISIIKELSTNKIHACIYDLHFRTRLKKKNTDQDIKENGRSTQVCLYFVPILSRFRSKFFLLLSHDEQNNVKGFSINIKSSLF